MSSNLENYFQKIQNIIQQKITENPKLSFPCKYMVFHQSKKYCQECEDFICDKCIKKHDESHKILTLEEIIENLSSKINLYLDVSRGKFSKEEGTQNTTEKVELDENIEKNAIEKIDNLINKLNCIKKKMLKFFKLRNEILKKYNSEEHNIVYEDQLMERITTPEKLEIKEIDEKEIKNIHDLIKFEKNDTIVFKTYIDFCKDLNNKTNEIIINNHYRKKLSNKDNMSVYERINLKTNELNLIMSDLFIYEVDSFLNKSIPEIDTKILSTEDIFKNVICAYLKIEDEQYQTLLENTEIEDEPKKIVEKIIEVPKEIEKIVEKKIEINKSKFSPNELAINQNNRINIFIPPSYNNKNIDKNKNKDKDNDDDNENYYINDNDSKDINVDSEHFQINNMIEPNNNNENNENNIDKNKLSLNKPNSMLKRSTVIQKKGEIGAYASISLSAQNVKDIMQGTYNEAKAVIVTKNNKFLIDSSEEIEECQKSCLKKLAILNSNKAKEDFDLNTELSKFEWKERNMFELLFPVQDEYYISLYNPYINKVEAIDIQTDEKFPLDFALLFKLPYCYISGGRLKNKDGEMEELSSFYALRRDGPKIVEKILLPDMLEPKINHCLFEISYINSICALGGKNSKDVEIYDLEEKTWKNLPDLNYPRQGPVCCIINETFLYCFFGYDNENSSYLTSIEKYDLVYKGNWEVLNPYGNKTFMKKKYCGCVKYRKNFEENIYIVGGINVLNSESKDCLIYDEKNNTIEKAKDISLPYKSSFNSSSFIQLPNNIYYNMSYDCQLIQYEPLGKIFYGIRDK